MNCFEIQVRGVSFKIWAPTLQDALETFMIDMDFFEVPSEVVSNDFYMPENIPAGFQNYFLDFPLFRDNMSL